MESQGKKKKGSPLITSRVEANTTCTCVETPPPSISGGDPELALLLRCNIKYTRSGRGRGQRHVRAYRGGNDEACFVGTVPRGSGAPAVDDDSVRAVIRGVLRDIRPLRDLELTDAEWDAIVPEDVVPQLADLARGLADEDGSGSRAAVAVVLEVDRHVRYNAPRMLMTACSEAAAAGTGGKNNNGGECSICFEALQGEKKKKGGGVELPGCAHAFHRRCISEWFRKKPTCPLCRGDVTEHLDPELRNHLADLNREDEEPAPISTALLLGEQQSMYQETSPLYVPGDDPDLLYVPGDVVDAPDLLYVPGDDPDQVVA